MSRRLYVAVAVLAVVALACSATPDPDQTPPVTTTVEPRKPVGR